MSRRLNGSGMKISAPRNGNPTQHRILIGTPTLGNVRIEWHNALSGVVIPTNWANAVSTPIGFLVDDAQNIVANEAIAKNFDWLLLVEDDVIIPIDLYQRMRKWVDEAKYPMVAGLYHLKSDPPEPMVYRGRGNGPFRKWKLGDVVPVDAVPTGCTLISVKLLKAVAAHRNERYTIQVGPERKLLSRIFETPRYVWNDPALGTYRKMVGTSDLQFCDYVLEHNLLPKAGWPKLAKEKYPFIVDTRIQCGHIDRNTGRLF